MQELFALALDEPRHGDARPARYDGGDLLLGDGVVHHGALLLLLRRLHRVGELFLQSRKLGVLESGRGLILIAQLRVFDVRVELFYLALELFHLVHAALFAFPARLHLVELVLEIAKLLAQLGKAVAAELVVLLFQRHFLDFELHDLAADAVKLFRHGVDLRADLRARLIDKVNGLVGEEPVGDIPVGQRRGGDKGAVVDAHAVVDLVALFQTAENGDRVLDRRLIDLHGLEAALERGVLFDILAVLVERRGADAVQLAARKHRLQKVAGVHAALGFAGADDGMQLIDEEDDAALALADFFEHGLEPFLKFAAVLGAGDQRAHVKRENGFVFQAFRHVAAHNALRQTLGNGGFADARLADENGVVFRFAGEDADDVPDLHVTADHGVQLVFPGALDKVGAVFGESVVGALRVVAGHGAGLYLGKRLGKGGFRDAVVGENALDGRGGRGKNTDHQMFHGDILIAHGFRGLFGGADGAVALRGEIHLAHAADLRQRGNGRIKLGEDGVAVYLHFAEQRRDQPAVLIDESIEKMLGGDIVVAVFLRHGFGGADRVQTFLGEFFRVHENPSLIQ